jgi:hypothetical protein
MKSKVAMTGMSKAPERWSNWHLRRSFLVPCWLIISLSVRGLLALERISRRLQDLVRYIPEWLSWLSYKPLARYGHDLWQEVMYGPLSFVRESMVRKCSGDRACLKTHQAIYQTNGTARQSLALDNLQEAEKLQGPEREGAEKVVAGALASMYAGE